MSEQTAGRKRGRYATTDAKREGIVIAARTVFEREGLDGASLRAIAAEALDRLMSYGWPGNVRELENVIQHAMVMAGGGVILPEHLPIAPGSGPPPAAAGTLEQLVEQKLAECVRGLGRRESANLYDLLIGLVESFFPQECEKLLLIHALNLPRLDFEAERLADVAANRLPAILGTQEVRHPLLDLMLDHVENDLPAILAVEDSLAEAVNLFPLIVHHLVVFEQMFSLIKVLLLALLLGAFDAAGNHRAFDGLAFLHAQIAEHRLHPVAGEDPQQLVFERKCEADGAGIALSACPPSKLVVNPAAVVTLGSDDV